MFARIRSLLRGIRQRDALYDEMEAEFRLHLELRAEDLVKGGLSPAEAVRRARLEFGSTESAKDHGREARGLRAFDSLRFSILDLKLGGRMLVKHPGLTVIGTIAVAFAIAVGTAAFEGIKQALFPTIPLPQGDGIVALRNWNVAWSGPADGSSRRDYTLWKQDLTTITNIAAIEVRDRSVVLAATGAGGGESITVADVTASMFSLTRVPALMGRSLLATDERPDAPDVAVIGYDFWQNKLGGGADVIGRVIRISGAPTTIVGVMPRDYAFPRRNGLWRPLHLERINEISPRLRFVFARVAPGRTFEQASAELAALGERTRAAFPETHKDLRAQLVTMPHAVFELRGIEAMVLGSVNIYFVMLLALICGNVALLLCARAASRQTEIVVRIALGASRGRIIMQLFAEALVLCTVGLGVGLVASHYVLQWAWAMADGQRGPLPFWMGRSLSPTTVLYAVGLTLFAAAIAGVVPGIKATSGGIDGRLRAMSSGGGGLQFGGLWTAIIVAQIAFTVTLPVVTNFLRQDYVRYRDMPAGFAAEEFLTASLGLDRLDGAAAGGDTTPALRAARFEKDYVRLADRLRAEPNVIDVTYANRMPLMHPSPLMIEMDSGPVAPRDSNWPEGYRVSDAAVDPRFFDVVGASMILGRSFAPTDAEQDTRAIVVNESFVKRVMGGRNPIGRQFRLLSNEGQRPKPGDKPGAWRQIVGVTRDLGVSPMDQDPSAARVYFATLPRNTGPLNIAVHTRGDPQRLTIRLRELAAVIDPALRVVNPMPLPRVLDEEANYGAFWVHLLTTVATIALVLSLAGVYAVTAFAVAKRTREIGVRVALGANPRQIIFTVFKRPFMQIALGIAVGAAIMTTLVTVGTNEVTLRTVGEPGAFVLILGMVCMLGCLVPVRRALSIQPTEALKDEG